MPQGQNDSRLPVDSREAARLELDRRFRLPLRAYFGRRISNPAEAEDRVQDVLGLTATR
jgi:DNA-directed RNA polymerase specialized sigma24 family protein